MEAIHKIRKVPDLSSAVRVRRPILDKIPVRPGPRFFAPKEDPLEKAALQNVPGTLPERIVWKWLIDEDHIFEAQSIQEGGRMVIGGSVVDFLVYSMAGRPVCIRVMGDYWHGPQFPERQARDDEQRARLNMMGYIVCDLWEHDIYEAVLQNRLTSYIENEVGNAA